METIGAQFPRKVTIGRCIYCGNADVPLTKEHIVPYCLGGSWVLHKASCKQCADISRRFEGWVSTEQALGTRIVRKLPIRRKEARSRTLPLKVKQEGKAKTIDVPTSDYPVELRLNIYRPPAYIDNRNYKSGISITGTFYVLKNPNKTRDSLGIEEYTDKTTIHGTTQAQLLAKIAYGFAVYKYGQSIIDTAPVRNSILARTEDIGMWVGRVDTPNLLSRTDLIATSKIHEIRLGVDNNNNICAYIRLFRYYKVTPVYLVIVSTTNN